MRTSGASSSSRIPDSYLGGQDQQYMPTMRNGASRPSSYLGDDADYRAGFPPGLNGNLDGDLSRRQDPRQAGYAPSRDPSLPPSRGNGSPAIQDRYPFSGGHTPSNSVGLSRAALAGSIYPTAAPSKAAVPPRQYDMSSRGHQEDPNTALASVSSLSLDDRPASGANGVGLNPSPRGPNTGVPVQSWPSNGPKTANYAQAPTSVNGYPPVGQADPRHAAPSRGPGPEHVASNFAPGTGHYTPPRDGRSQRPASRDTAMPQANGQALSAFFDEQTLAQYFALFQQPTISAELAASMHGYNLASNLQQQAYRGPGYQAPMRSYVPPPPVPGGRAHDPTVPMRGPVLDHFRNLKPPVQNKWTIAVRLSNVALSSPEIICTDGDGLRTPMDISPSSVETSMARGSSRINFQVPPPRKKSVCLRRSGQTPSS